MQLPPMLQGKRKDRCQEGQMLEGGSENLHMRKAIDHYQLPSSPPLGSSGCFLETRQGQALAPLSCRAGRWDSSGQGSHSLPQFEPLWDLLLLRAAVPAPEGDRPDPGPAPCVAECLHQGLQDSSKPARQGHWTGGRKAQVNAALSGPRGLPPKRSLAGADPEGSGKEGLNPAHSTMSPTQTGRLGQAKSQLLQLSSRQMVRIFLEFPAKVGLQALRDTEIHRYTGGSSGIRAGQLEYAVLKPTGRGREGREERSQRQPSCFFQEWDIVCVVLRREALYVTVL